MQSGSDLSSSEAGDGSTQYRSLQRLVGPTTAFRRHQAARQRSSDWVRSLGLGGTDVAHDQATLPARPSCRAAGPTHAPPPKLYRAIEVTLSVPPRRGAS